MAILSAFLFLGSRSQKDLQRFLTIFIRLKSFASAYLIPWWVLPVLARGRQDFLAFLLRAGFVVQRDDGFVFVFQGIQIAAFSMNKVSLYSPDQVVYNAQFGHFFPGYYFENTISRHRHAMGRLQRFAHGLLKAVKGIISALWQVQVVLTVVVFYSAVQ